MQENKPKRLLSLLLILALVMVGLQVTVVYAFDNSCAFCGEPRSDDYLCSDCGGCGGVIEGCTCWIENHCPNCDQCLDNVNSCENCWRCEECFTICPNCEQCWDCGAMGIEYNCPDCGQCANCIEYYCTECERCVACVDMCGEEGHTHCIECVDYCPECYKCSDSWTIPDLKCESCGICCDCLPSGMCSRCNSCEDCVGGFCAYIDDGPHCEDCSAAFCMDCGTCAECRGVDLCWGCGTCIECNGLQCESCGMCQYCVFICENGDSCSDCNSMCLECYYCSNCVDICGSCYEICGVCMTMCGSCDSCEVCADVCAYCDLTCSNCGNICQECNERCDQCFDLCKDCGVCSECVNLCSVSADYCAYCADLCDDCYGCEYCTTLCSVNGDSCYECLDEAEFCFTCGACSNCATICPACGEACTECTWLCEFCGLCRYDPEHDWCESCDECLSAPSHVICSNCGDHLIDFSYYTIDENYHDYRCSCENLKVHQAVHNFGYRVVNDPTETEDGSGEFFCHDCGYISEVEVVIPATGGSVHTHTYDLWNADTTSHRPLCSCGTTLPSGWAYHTFEWVIDQEPTKTTAGLKHEECTVCGYEKAQVSIPATSHTCSFSDQWSNDETKHWHECSCGEISDYSLHVFGAWTITGEPTETTAGQKERQCVICKYYQVVVIPATSENLVVTFDTQGGSSVAVGLVKNGSKVIRPEDPVYEGFIFDGWYTTAACEIPWNFNQCIYQATSLYAKWTEYKITSGADGTWKKGTGTGLEIICNGDCSKFTGLKVDGAEIDATNYTVVSGSTVITLQPSYLETLPLGKHTLELVYTDKIVQTEFTIWRKSTSSGSSGSIEPTGDLPGPTEAENEWVNPFLDVQENSWYYEAVKYVNNNDLMQGTGEDTFSPDLDTSRGMIVTILHRLEGKPIAGANPFSDVKENKYYSEAVSWTSENKIINGYGDDKFRPEDPITREQLAAILMNYAKYKGYDVSAETDLSKYEDSKGISNWAIDAMSWANAEGLIQGDGNNLIPTGNATRAQVAAILNRFVEMIVK